MPVPPDTLRDLFSNNFILIVEMPEPFIAQILNGWTCGFQRIIVQYWNPNDRSSDIRIRKCLNNYLAYRPGTLVTS